jgi:hypothetical protein
MDSSEYEETLKGLNGTDNDYNSTDSKSVISYKNYADLWLKLKVIATTIAIFGFLANAFVLFVMLKTKKFRKNRTNYFIIVTLTFDLLFALWFLFYLVRSSITK